MESSERKATLRRQIKRCRALSIVLYSVAPTQLILGLLALHKRGLTAVVGAILIFSWGLWLIVGEVASNRAKAARGRLRLIEAREDMRPFYLLLRPFYNSPVRYSLVSFTLEGNIETHEVEDDLTRAVCPLVYLLPPAKGLLLESNSTALPLPCKEELWPAIIQTLLRGCRAVFVIPESTAGLMDELEQVVGEGLSGKTIVIMPPPIEDPEGRRAERWNFIRENLAARGVRLPPYDDRGCVYLADEQLSIRDGAVTWLACRNSRLEFGPALESALKPILTMLPPGEPLSQLLAKLDQHWGHDAWLR